MKIKNLLRAATLCLLTATSFFGKAADDWSQFKVFETQNQEAVKSGKSPKAVFMGNSITEGWAKFQPEFFTSNNFIGRGISGQTTYQMLLRFRDDVINLHPEYVVIAGGANDVAENNHNYNEDRTFGNIVSMAELAEANGIKPILTSLLPAGNFYWRKTITNVPEKIQSLNHRIEAYAKSKGYPYVNYYDKMTKDNKNLNPAYTKDGVHPNVAGYKVMEELILPVIQSE